MCVAILAFESNRLKNTPNNIRAAEQWQSAHCKLYTHSDQKVIFLHLFANQFLEGVSSLLRIRADATSNLRSYPKRF